MLKFVRNLFFIVVLIGTAIAFGQPQLVLNTPKLDFGNIKVGHYVETSLLLTNTGTDTLRVTDMSAGNPSFTVTPPKCTIAPGKNFTTTVRFTPASTGTYSSQITIVSNSPSSPTLLPVSGFGLSASVVDTKTILYRNEPLGDQQYRKEGTMDGNLVVTLFNNDGEVGHWPLQPSGIWPKGTDHSFLDGVALLIGSKVKAPGNNKIVTPIESAYREEVDFNPDRPDEQWVLQPVPGYAEPSATSPAMNINPATFPKHWPTALGLTPEWDGLWYGYFGRGVNNADQETFFVMDDSKDKEFTRAPYSYYPIVSDSTRGGLGIRIEVRGFQWSHVLAEDIIFWHYDIVNISDNDYDTTCFGFYTDPGVGGTNNNGNSARYDTKLDLAYAWCTSGKGVPGNYKTGYVGYAYLESPGNGFNHIDDDEDGMVDERRDDNIDNNHNWMSYSDLNHNGKWDPREPLNDDVGRDGVGPTDLQYTGPDEGEGDGLPTHGEPNFDELDKDESDQIGLQAISIYTLADKGPSGGWPKNDDVIWNKMNNGFRDTVINNTNISMVFSSGPFPWKQTKRERFSMALVFGEDLDDLEYNVQTVQDIYNANYNFTKPPYKPIVTAVPGNGKVFLYWDQTAETSVDRFMGFEDPNDWSKGYKNIFEGYLVYRSQEPEFNDIKVVTDSRGTKVYWKPLAQFDLIDSIKGPDPVGNNGAHFWRGTDNGLQHSYIDSTVTNGVRYFYAIVSYSKGGYPQRGSKPLQPTECSKIISADYAGNIKFVDINCAVVTPNVPAAGYIPPRAEGDLNHVAKGIGTGKLNLIILDPAQIRQNAEYTVRFIANAPLPAYKTKTAQVIRLYNGVRDTIIKELADAELGPNKYTRPFDGMTFSVLNDSVLSVADTATGWVVGTSNVIMRAAFDNSNYSLNARWPADYEIRFFDTFADTTSFDIPPEYPRIPVKFTITNTTSNARVKFIIYDTDNSGTLTLGDTLRILDGYVDDTNFKIAYKVTYGRPYGAVSYPKGGDRFVIKTRKPFFTDDQFVFKTHTAETNKELAGNQLKDIIVVPNPYFAAASWEARTLYSSGGRDRKIEFKKLPAKCTIRIYTVAGTLVKTLEKNTPSSNGALSWNLVSDDGMDIAYGLYIFHVDAPEIGEYIGKFAVVK
jgi:hypothetical protein